MKIQATVRAYETYGFDHSGLLTCLLERQPEVTLSRFLGGDEGTVKSSIDILHDASHHHPNPMDVVSDDRLIQWCNDDAAHRFAAAAAVVTLDQAGTDDQPRLLAPIVQKLIDEAPDPTVIVRQIARRCRPMSWSGSLSALIEANVRLLDQIATGDNPALVTSISEEKVRLLEEAQARRQWDTHHDRERDESFE